MRKKAPLTVERKNSKGGFASEQTPHPSSCPPLAADRPRPFRCSSFSHTNRFAGFAWEPCPFANPLKTTKEEAIPLPWNHHPSEYRRWRNSIRQIFNGRKRNNSHGILCAWETQSDGPTEGRSLRDALSVKGTQKQNAFSARQRYFVLQRLFSPHSFLARQKRMGRRRHTAPSAHPKHAAGGSARRADAMCSACYGMIREGF